MHIDVPKMSIAELALLLSGHLDRPVIDQTGIAGTFLIRLDYGTESGRVPIDPDAPRPPTVSEALQDDLGLRLEARKGEAPSIVVEEALKKPREN